MAAPYHRQCVEEDGGGACLTYPPHQKVSVTRVALIPPQASLYTDLGLSVPSLLTPSSFTPLGSLVLSQRPTWEQSSRSEKFLWDDVIIPVGRPD